VSSEKRHSDPEFLAEMRKLRCLACGHPPPSEVHHIKTRGSGGGDEFFNVMPVCRGCHQAWHKMGMQSFIQRHGSVQQYLEALGWELGTVLGKWKAIPPAIIDQDGQQDPRGTDQEGDL
jgi:hypothetical protein